MRYRIESRETPAAKWMPWPFVTELSSREDAERQAQLLQSREPAPTRFASTTREFRAVAVACPRCFEGAQGDVCGWHAAMDRLDAATPAPVPVRERKPIAATLRERPRNLGGSYQSRLVARQFEQLKATVRRALEGPEQGGSE